MHNSLLRNSSDTVDSVNDQYDTLFVGAGPVGLYTAIQAKLHNPELNIVMLERHETYVRNHILIINPKSYEGSHPDQEFQDILKDLQGPVLTTKIEEDLKDFAQKLGIKFEHRKIDDVDALSREYPNAKTIIGADGARSLVRKQVFRDLKSTDEALQYIVEVKYKAKGTVQKLEPARYGLALSQVEHFVAEHIGKTNKNGETPVSLFFFVDKETYDEVQGLGGGAATGLKLADIDPQKSIKLHRLANSIRPWIAARKFCKEHYVAKSEKIAAVKLPAYRSNTFAMQLNHHKVHAGPNVLLVGDAAMGVPFFRALNAGFIGANEAAQVIAGKKMLDNYNKFMNKLSDKEINNARWKSKKVDVGQSLTSVQRVLRKGFAVSMKPSMLHKMQNARVKPANIFKRNPRMTSALILLLILVPVMILTGGIGAIPFVGAALVGAVGAIAASSIAAAASVLLVTVLFKATEFSISLFRKKPPVNLPELDHEKLPWELSDESSESSDSDGINYSSRKYLSTLGGSSRDEQDRRTEVPQSEVRDLFLPLGVGRPSSSSSHPTISLEASAMRVKCSDIPRFSC